jgi:hypothetical protein
MITETCARLVAGAPHAAYLREFLNSAPRVRRSGPAAVCGVQLLGLFELVLEDDDAARGLDRSAPVHELTGAGRDAQLVAGVAAVAARGAQRGDQAGFADRAEEALGGAAGGW